MVSSSKTAQRSTTNNSDERIIADGESTAINSGGGAVQIVADEAFDIAQFALMENSDLARSSMENQLAAMSKGLSAAKSESTQLGEQIVKIGIPAAAVIFIAWSMSK